jgi:competence protein ComEC
VRFTLLSPPETAFTKENDNSCVLKIETGKFSFLLPGDIEQNAESWLARQYGEQLKSTVLIAPHHGSKTSSSFDFLNQVQPELVAIPAGYLNRFGFPHKSVTARYQQLNLQWLNTSDAGAISIRAGVERLLVESERDIHKHYWMTPREVR